MSFIEVMKPAGFSVPDHPSTINLVNFAMPGTIDVERVMGARLQQLPVPVQPSYNCPMIDHYKEHSVDPRLAPYVDCYWTHLVAGDLRGSHPVIPDGCIDLLFESGTQALNIVGT